MVSKISFVLLFLASFFVSGLYGKYFYLLLMQSNYIFLMWLPIAVLVVCICFYLLGLMSRRTNFGVWLSIWETNSFLAVIQGRTHLNLMVFNAAVWVGFLFIFIGFVLFSVGFDILYWEYISIVPRK